MVLMMGLIKFLLCASLLHVIHAKGSDSRVECTPDMMKVVVPMDGNRQLSYLEQLKGYRPCEPTLEDGVAVYHLDLLDPHQCGVTRIINKITGKKVFYHKIMIEDVDGSQESLKVRCVVAQKKLKDLRLLDIGGPHTLVKRAVDLPVGFQEPEVLEITTSLEEHAPEPQLGVAVKQNGKKVSGEISVYPGTALSMEIFLDNSSAPVYGLLVSYMQVTDTQQQQETIIINGCSVDPYLFDNFVTEDGDKLSAKFRAFKFPDTTYVQFKGTVTVCLDRCQGVSCSNGATGYGRRRRSVDSRGDPNRVFEVSLTTFIKVEGGKEQEDVLSLLRNLKVANQMLEERSIDDKLSLDGTPATVRERTPNNELKLHRQTNASSTLRSNVLVAILFSLALVLYK